MQSPLKIYFIFTLIFLTVAALSLHLGSTPLGLNDYFYLDTLGNDHFYLVLKLRLERTFIGLFCGACLASAGVISQGLFRNDLASPSILGATAGASLGVVFCVLFFWQASLDLWWLLPASAILGCLIATFGILGLAKQLDLNNMSELLLLGFAWNALFAAIQVLLTSLAFEDWQRVPALMSWLFGGFGNKGWPDLFFGLGPACLGAFLAILVCKSLDVLNLGENLATTLGIALHRVQVLSITSISLLIGSAVAVGGNIVFVGLIVPHITRKFLGPSHLRLFIWSAVNGASLLLLADILGRIIRRPAEIYAGALVGLLGAPFFIVILIQKRKAPSF